MVVKQAAAGGGHSMVLTRDGDVFTWGFGFFGQLGHGNTDDQLVPKRVGGLTNVTDIAAGSTHSLALVEGGAVYTWGYNDRGQLGLGDHGYSTDRNVPTEVPGVNEVVAVAAGSCHSFVLSREGTVMACGDNGYGQLGLGDTDNRDTFTVVPGLKGVVDIDAGGDHSIAATLEGEVYTWGKGWGLGQGGDDDTQRLSPTKVTGGGLDGVVVVQIAAGYTHSMALTAAGDLYTWGRGRSGRLGHGDEVNRSVPTVVGGTGAVMGMAGSEYHSLVTTREGRVLGFGYNEYDQLGLGAEALLSVLTPVAIGDIRVIGNGDDGEGKEGKE